MLPHRQIYGTLALHVSGGAQKEGTATEERKAGDFNTTSLIPHLVNLGRLLVDHSGRYCEKIQRFLEMRAWTLLHYHM